MSRFEVEMKYANKTEFGNHKLTETWECEGLDNLKKILCEALDLVKDKDCIPKKPNEAEFKNAMKDFADDTFIANEFKRQVDWYGAYETLVNEATKDCGLEDAICLNGAEVELDANTKIRLSKV